ncbi:MAG: 2-oxoacid:acceptor oxidoreductase subunit alpha [Candidatus Wildermuthbacteria bacterium]|nr:2-oxoacid:acceptor oxidoreductase subunit alpha [Candidatus Wildermuthbacteria bacterium]
MEKTILIGGAAGQGSAVTSHFIGKIFCHLGFYVFNYRDYPSLIRGGHNFNILTVSSRPVLSQKEKYDIILAFDQKTIDLHQDKLNKGGVIFGNKNLKSERLHPIDIGSILAKIGGPKILENDILIGALFKHVGADTGILMKEAEREFPRNNELIKKAIEEGYNLVESREGTAHRDSSVFAPIAGKAKYFLSGTDGVALGAIAAGLDIYFAYPMTPATPLLNFFAKNQSKYNILTLQLEDEISVVNAALGASFGGAKVMVGTSGGGFALMTEALSLAGMAELPVVIYLGQRTAPSSGIPTYTGQSDLKFALNAGHGEFLKIVSAPGDPEEAIFRTQEAFYLSLKYRTPAIILSDKHLAESDYSFDEISRSPLAIQKLSPEEIPENYKTYQITKNGISPVAFPGQGKIVRVNSYEHDEEGNTTESPIWSEKMNDKRFMKLPYLEKEVDKFHPVSVYGKGKNLIIGWGSTKGAIIDALPELKNYRFLQISYISPFPRKQVIKEIKKSKKIILVENNVTGLLGDIIAEQTGFIIKNKVLKYDARPFTVEYLINKIRTMK